jgi:CheY-like chemotaxis protein
VVTTVLRKRGHDIQVARARDEALKLASELTPEIVIADALLSSADGMGDMAGIIGMLRRAMAPADPALLVLSSLAPKDERVQAMAGDGYLAKPFRFVDLDRAVEQTIQARKRRTAAHLSAQAVADSPMGSGIHGTLDQLGLGSLLTMIEMERKSGILLLRRGSLSARIYCRDGRVMAARLYGTTPISGVEVVYKLLAWTDGHFNFTAMPVSVTDEIGLRTTHLLLEGARRNDEAQAQRGS